MFTMYFVRGYFEMKGIGGIFCKKNIHETVKYQRSFVVDTGADILKIAQADMMKQMNELEARLKKAVASSKTNRASTYYGHGHILLRDGDEFKQYTKTYCAVFHFIPGQVAITNEEDITYMSVNEAREILTVAQWKRLMAK